MADPIAAALRAGLGRLVRANLRGVWLRGALPAGSFVWAANHHSWWDPFVAGAVLASAGRSAGLLMKSDNLSRYAFARRLGVFGADEPRQGVRHLRDGRVLIIFPEGRLRPAGPIGPLARGAAWYAEQAAVPLAAVAVRVVVRGHQAPEAYARVSLVADPRTEQLADDLAANLSTLDKELASADPREPLDGFQRVVRGRRSWDERLARSR
jgi:1-acyl-sn-glycerol-3-phosphate acyltransferase